MSRKKARDTAFKCIYQMEFSKEVNIDEILQNNFLEHNNDEDEKEYISLVVLGVKEHLKEIDENILSKLKDWTIERITKIDLAILRLAIYEILYIEDLSNKISANEAVELAKTYGSDNSSNFVNGIIAKVIENV